jgi:hypothetical protein
MIGIDRRFVSRPEWFPAPMGRWFVVRDNVAVVYGGVSTGDRMGVRGARPSRTNPRRGAVAAAHEDVSAARAVIVA